MSTPLVKEFEAFDHSVDSLFFHRGELGTEVHVGTDVLCSLVRSVDSRTLSRQDDLSPLLCDGDDVVQIASDYSRTERLVACEDRHCLSTLVVLRELEPTVGDECDVTAAGLSGDESVIRVTLASSRVGEHLKHRLFVAGGVSDHCNL